MTYIPNRSKYGISVPDGALNGWRLGVASGKPRVRIFGDSQTFGQLIQTPTNSGGDAWRSKLRDQLVAWSKIGALGAEFHPCIYNAALATAVGYSWGGTPPWVQNVAPASLSVPGTENVLVSLPYTWEAGLGGTATWAAQTLDSVLMTFNGTNALPNFAAADIILNQLTLSSPPARYDVADTGNTNFANITGAANGLLQITQLNSLTGSPKIEILGAGAGTQLWLDGITTWYAGRSGNGLQWASIGFPSGDLSNYGAGVWENAAGYDGSAYAANLFPCVPHLAIIMHGLNDMRRVTPATFQTNLAAMVRTLRRAGHIAYGAPMSVVLILEDQLDTGIFGLTAGPSDGGLHGGGSPSVQASWIEYMRAMPSLADSLESIMINWCALEYARPLAFGHSITNDAHMTVAGHQALADLAASVLIL